MNHKQHSIGYDSVNNRLYITLSGFWKDETSSQPFIKDIIHAITLTKPYFSAIIDISDFKVPTPETIDTLKKVSYILYRSGLTLAAEVKSKDIFADLAIEKIKRASKYASYRGKFTSLEEAEEWLNTKLSSSLIPT